ncbi:MAG: hypothetical protein IPQ07_23840 [Myxococcales bacterium]|nr:hypothetical protein [Myxococcales bacterium]
MSDVMAIVSKAVFEKAAGKAPALGTRLGLDRYVSANKGLAPLTGGGRLFLVTVRPPDEALWLVAVLDSPAFTGGEWVATACTTPLTEISGLKAQLVFESGKGLPTTAGTLGMSLQTPRVLTAADTALLDGVLAGAPAGSAAPAPTRPAKPAADPAAPLLAAVLAAPREDAPKLALGAHWRSVGEPRGELVEIDLELRGRLSIPRRKLLRARKAELLAANEARWWPWTVTSRRQRAGFIVAIMAEAAELLPLAPTLFGTEPITELELIGLDEEVIAEVAKAPWLGKLSALALRGPIGDEGFTTLVRSKHLANLEALNVSVNELSSEALAGLGKALPSLRRLVLTGNGVGDEGAAALAAWPHLPQLRTLYLTACDLTSTGVAALVGSGKVAGLEKLTLAQNELGDAGGEVIAAHAAALPALRYLELAYTQLSDPGAKALAAAVFPHMRHLDVSGNWCSRNELRATYRDALIDS